MDDLSETPVSGVPSDGQIAYVEWAPDDSHMAFAVRRAGGFELWVAETAAPKARRLGAFRLNAVGGNPIRWLSSSDALIVATVPNGHPAAPMAAAAPAGPTVQESKGTRAPARTYQDLLQNAHDEDLFDHFMTAQLMRVGLDGSVKALGKPQVLGGFDTSPDGSWLLVQRHERPYSYLVPASRFPRVVEAWPLAGGAPRTIAQIPLKDAVPTAFGSVPDGPRSFEWRADKPATLVWAEAQDGGDAGKESELRDKVFQLAAPFDGKGKELVALQMRFGGIEWKSDGLAMATEWWWKTRRARVWKIEPGDTEKTPQLMFDLNFEDSYADPGNPMTVTNEWGRSVLLTDDKERAVYMIGDGASPEGERPFLDRLDLRSGQTERLFRSEAPHYERPVAFLDDDMQRVMTRRESKDDPPNYFARDLGKKKADALRMLTEFPHPTPQLAGLEKELIRYEREDGVDLNATLYLPPGYDKQRDGKLPVVVWAYPQEFKSADAAGQITDSPHRFDRVSWASPLLFLTLGYAVLDDPTMPIIGEGDEEPNDTYVEQLVSSAAAALKEADRRGVVDARRAAVGGHSYGAFMTANLLAHSDLFRAGIARSGAYNRTLTPFGFQAEERTFWEAADVYLRMSPFVQADQIDEPMLMIHGEADNNSGTFPMQSKRMYAAMKGLGGKARLVMLPHESHGYRARESILHMWWEQVRWLDRYVMQADLDGAVGSP